MYEIRLKAVQCNSKINQFMQANDIAECLGVEVILSFETNSKVDDSYVSKLINFMANSDFGGYTYKMVQFLSYSKIEERM